MPSTVEQLSPSRVKITVEVPFAELKPSLDKAYRDIASQVNIPGFRAGKVPPLVIDQRFGRGVVLQEAINQALPQLYGQAVTENNLNPLGEPEVEVTKLEDNELVEFTAEVDVRPDFELPDLDAITVEMEPVTVDDETVEEQIQILRERFGTMSDVDRPAAEGDVITFDLQGSQNGEELEEATAEGVQYKLGSGGMIEGLDEAVTGLSAGDSNEFNAELVGGPLRGERVDIKVTLQKVQEQELPEVDDEFAQMVSEFDTAAEMRADLETAVERMKRVEQANNARDRVLEAVIAQIDVPLPDKLLEGEINARHEQIKQQLAQAGLTLDQYLADSEVEQSAEEFWADVDTNSRKALTAQLVLDKLADEKEIGVDQQDLTQHIMTKAQQNGTTPDQEAAHMMEHNHMGEWMSEIRRGKALAFIVESATVTDTEGNDLNLKNLRSDGTYADPEAEAAEAQAVAEAAAAEVEQTDAASAAEAAEAAAAADQEPVVEEQPAEEREAEAGQSATDPETDPKA